MAQQRADNHGWRLAVVLFFMGWTMIYANRTVLSPVMKVLEIEWSLTKTELGLLTSAFFLTYSLMQVPNGILADRVGRKKLLVPGYFLHGLAAAASGLAMRMDVFLAARALTGLGQSTYFSTQYALASSMIPPQQRGLGISIINSGMAFGVLLGWAAGAFFAYRQGLSWRAPFYILGALTLLLAVLMSKVIKEPPAGETVHKQPFVHKALTDRNLLLVYLANFCSLYAFFVILTWYPYFLQEVRGFPGDMAGLIPTLMPLAAIPAGIVFGRLSDRLGYRRRIMYILFPIAALSVLMLGISTSLLSVILFLLLYGFSGKLASEPLIIAMVADMTPAHARATVYGLLTFTGTIAVILAPVVTGFLADVSGGFNAGFYLATALQVVALGALLLIRQPSGTNLSQSQ